MLQSLRLAELLKNYLNPAISLKLKVALSLTEVGKNLAEQLYERHCFLPNILLQPVVNPKIAEHDACNLEHVISEESFQKLKRCFGEPRRW